MLVHDFPKPCLGRIPNSDPDDPRGRAVTLEQLNEVDVLRDDHDIGGSGPLEDVVIARRQEAKVQNMERLDAIL